MKNKKIPLLIVCLLLASVGGLVWIKSSRKLSNIETPSVIPVVQNTPSQSNQVNETKPVEATAPVAKQCHELTYESTDKKIQPRELIILESNKINPQSVCLRVNGVVVRHQIKKQKSNEILMSSLPTQVERVTVQYCDAEVKCLIPCIAKKDEFLSALSGGEENLESDPLELASGWEGSDSELDAEEGKFKKDVQEFRKEMADSRHSAANGALIHTRWKKSETHSWCENSLKASR